jgi:dTDP-glucose 4,6-dehydratase
MSKVLLTGAAGFIGHHMLDYLVENTDHEIVCLVRLNKIGYLGRIEDIRANRDWKDRVKIVWHDLKSPINPSVSKAIGNVDTIIHMGAETHVDRSISDPMEFVLSNVVGTANLLDFARDHSGCYIQFSTDEVFGPAPEGVAYYEYDRHNANNPYAATKAGAEQLVMAYGNTYSMRTVIIRSMNVFGPRQHPEKFIPLVIHSILTNKLIQIHANPDLTKAGSRYYIHAKNLAGGVKAVMDWSCNIKASKQTPAFHIVGEKEVDNKEMVKAIADIIGKPARYEMINFHGSRPGHDLRYCLGDSRTKVLNWTRPETFEQGLKQTVEWYLNHKEWLET